jgi:hypothetical protein
MSRSKPTGIYFDRDCQPVTAEVWRMLFAESTTVALDKLPERDTVVWTGWHGLALMRDSAGRPKIFHTIVMDFDATPRIHPWTTEAEAVTGHARIVAELRECIGRILSLDENTPPR